MYFYTFTQLLTQNPKVPWMGEVCHLLLDLQVEILRRVTVCLFLRSADRRRRVERCQVFPAGCSVVLTRQTFPHWDLWTHERPLLAAPKRLKHGGQQTHPPGLPPSCQELLTPFLLPSPAHFFLFCCLNLNSCFPHLHCPRYLIFCVVFVLFCFLIFYLCKHISRQSCYENISLLGFLKQKSCWRFIDFWGKNINWITTRNDF